MVRLAVYRGASRGTGAAWAGAVVVAGAIGCGGGPRDESDTLMQMPTSITQTGGGDDDGSAPGDSGSADGDGGGDSSTGGQKFDVGMGMGEGNAEAGDESGCDKVDFLFVIDNSGSMGDEQNNLISSFPQFIDTIQQELDEAQDYHVMVLDVDAWVYEGCQVACEPPMGCEDMNGACNLFACPFECAQALPCSLDGTFQCGVTEPMECEDVLGAGVTYPRGGGSSNMDCNFSTGARYMDSNEADLSASFECAAKVGTSSYALTEKPMEAMVQAVTPGTPAWDCNDGFLRDDAILVVTFITDEEDNGDSAGTAAGWKQALVAAKHGDESAVVVLGLMGDNCPPPNNNGGGAEQAPNLRAFVESFGDHGIVGQVCAPTYDDFFQQAVSLIDTTCEEFVPPEG